MPGEAVHWQADYCLYKVGTDDFFHEDVQMCMEKEEMKPKKSSCASKIEYKNEICRRIADLEPCNGSIKKCFRDAALPDLLYEMVVSDIDQQPTSNERGEND